MLINLRNALMTGKRLPYDAEVEYLESTGTQWIDTGVAVTNPSTVSVSVTKVSGNFNFGFTHANVAAGTWIGARTSVLNKAYFKNYSTTVDVPNTWQQLRWDGSSGLYADGALVGAKSASVGTDAIGSTSWPIFAMHEFNGGGVSQYSAGQISSVQIAVSGVLVRDFIPVRKGTVGYLYDRVSGKLFGNAGTGDFVLGPDVVPVEYIESHGTEYIDTGVPATGATDSEFQFKMSVARFAFGARTAWNASAYSLNYAVGNYAFNYGNNSVIADLKTSIRIDTNWHTAKIQSGGVLSLDEWTGTAGTFSFTTNGSLILFGTRQGSSLNLTASGFKYCKIWDNSLPVRSFLPVRVGTEGAMMDVLTRRIYRNAGTGAFTYGNDLKYPIPAE